MNFEKYKVMSQNGPVDFAHQQKTLAMHEYYLFGLQNKQTFVSYL